MEQRHGLVIRTGRTRGATVVHLTGHLITATVPDARQALREIIDTGHGSLRLDVGACTVGDSTALGLLVELMRRANRHGRRLELVHADARTRRLLRRVRLGRLLHFFECEHTVPVEAATA